MKVLIADDDDVTRLVLGRTLVAAGHEVLEAVDGASAWETVQQGHIPVVVSDWEMPDLDGLGLCRRIRAAGAPGKYTYVILLTARTGKTNYLEAMDAGADDFLTKPFDRDELIARLRVAERILGLHEQVTRLEGLLPICSYCKKIRDENQNWTVIEHYIAERTEAAFSHGISPSCYESIARPEMERVAHALRSGGLK